VYQHTSTCMDFAARCICIKFSARFYIRRISFFGDAILHYQTAANPGSATVL
jgi:hypothetical protein